MNYPVFEDDELPRPVAPCAPREEIPVPTFAVPDVSIVVDKTPARRQSTYHEWQKRTNLVFLEGKSGGSGAPRVPVVSQEIPQVPTEIIHPALERRSPLDRSKPEILEVQGASEKDKTDQVIARLEKLLVSYSNQLEGQICRLSKSQEVQKPPVQHKSTSVSPEQRSIGIQCDLLLPEVPPVMKSASQQTDFSFEIQDSRRASDSCLPGALLSRNPGQSDAWFSTEMSLATRQYMEKYNLLDESRGGSPSANRNVLEGIKGLRWQQKFH